MANTEENNITAQLKPLFPEHDFNKLYYKQDIVTFTINGELGFYQAIRNVPRFVPITDRTYWNLLTTGTNNYVDDESNQPTGPDYLCFTANKAGAQLMITGGYDPNYEDTFALEYSTDKETWNTIEFTTVENQDWNEKASDIFTFENIGDKIYFRGNNIHGTSYVNNNEYVYYEYNFCSPPDTRSENNEFSVTGDLQTIVNETGEDKENGGFYRLFSTGSDSVYITTAPNLTSTKLTDYEYAGIFMGQSLLEHPANMPIFTIEDINDLVGVFNSMYQGCTSLLEVPNFDMIVTNFHDVLLTSSNFAEIYEDCGANVTNDGVTLIGFANTIFPIPISGNENSSSIDSYIFAKNAFNSTKGFIGFSIEIEGEKGEKGEVILDYDGDYIKSVEIPENSTITYYLFRREDISKNCTLLANASSGFSFDRWLFADISSGTTNAINAGARFQTTIQDDILLYFLEFKTEEATSGR